jgi:hypothetical protein
MFAELRYGVDVANRNLNNERLGRWHLLDWSTDGHPPLITDGRGNPRVFYWIKNVAIEPEPSRLGVIEAINSRPSFGGLVQRL